MSSCAIAALDGALNRSWLSLSPGNAVLAERHQELPVRAELPDRIALAVPDVEIGHPDIPVAVGEQAVRRGEHVGAEIGDHLAGGIEMEDRRQVQVPAEGLLLAAIESPHAPAVAAIDRDAERGAPVAARRQLRPALVQPIRIGRGVGIGIDLLRFASWRSYWINKSLGAAGE